MNRCRSSNILGLLTRAAVVVTITAVILLAGTFPAGANGLPAGAMVSTRGGAAVPLTPVPVVVEKEYLTIDARERVASIIAEYLLRNTDPRDMDVVVVFPAPTLPSVTWNGAPLAQGRVERPENVHVFISPGPVAWAVPGWLASFYWRGWGRALVISAVVAVFGVAAGIVWAVRSGAGQRCRRDGLVAILLLVLAALVTFRMTPDSLFGPNPFGYVLTKFLFLPLQIVLFILAGRIAGRMVSAARRNGTPPLQRS